MPWVGVARERRWGKAAAKGMKELRHELSGLRQRYGRRTRRLRKAIKQSRARARATITRRTARLSERSFTAMSQCLYGWPKTPPRVAALVHPRSLPLTAQLLIPPLTSISCEWATSIRVATAQPCRCLAISLVPSKPPTRSRRLRATTVRYDCTARR